MPTTLPGPSSLARMAACIRSVIPPHTETISEYGEAGSVKHAFLADVLTLRRDEALARAKEADREWLSEIDTDALPASEAGAYAAEVSWALDLRTGKCREVGRNLTRTEARFRALPNEVVGTADLVGLKPGVVVILDYKTGWKAPRARDNMQLLTYAVMAQRAYSTPQNRITGAEIGIVHAPDDAHPWVDWVTVDEMELDLAFASLRKLYAEREEALALAKENKWDAIRPAVVGRHCKYCPRYLHCEANVELARRFRSDVRDSYSTLPIETLSDSEFLDFSQKLHAAEAVLKQLRMRHDGRLRHRPIPLGDGWVLGERKSTKETILPEKARPVLQELYGPASGQGVYNAAATVKTALPKEALKRALRALVLPGLPKADAKISKVMDAVMERLRAAKAVATSETSEVCEHQPKQGALFDDTAADG